MELTIITPCSRPQFLPKLYDSINFDITTKWIIVYDVSKQDIDFQFENNPKILEVKCNISGKIGVAQRWQALSMIKSGFVYFLDDDNIMHPEFWNLFPTFELDKFYSFNQEYCAKPHTTYGNVPKCGQIDTAMFVVPRDIIGDTVWPDKYAGDGMFIEEIYKKNKDKFCYINKIASYYNFITKAPWGGNWDTPIVAPKAVVTPTVIVAPKAVVQPLPVKSRNLLFKNMFKR